MRKKIMIFGLIVLSVGLIAAITGTLIVNPTGNGYIVNKYYLFDEAELESGTTTYSPILSLKDLKPVGYYALYLNLEDDGSIQANAYISNDYNERTGTGHWFDRPIKTNEERLLYIVDNFTATSGPNSDGSDYVMFNVVPGTYLKIGVNHLDDDGSPGTFTAILTQQ